MSGSKAASPAAFEKGVLIQKVTCLRQPEMSYALYLPSSYTTARRWPIVYAFDPAARGHVPVQLLQKAAEKYGYIVAGSNNSRNGPMGPQKEAADAVWADTHARLALDDNRLYVTGFSGSARLVTFLALECNCLAGVLSHGAGFPANTPPPYKSRFNYFLAMGDEDFNYPELVDLRERLRLEGFTYKLRPYSGPHRWAPPELWMEAMEWLELLAMKEGRKPKEDEFVARQFDQGLARARQLEQEGKLFEAYQEYRWMARDFQGLADLAAVLERTAQLQDAEPVRAGFRREAEAARLQREWTRAFLDGLGTLEAEPAARHETMFELQRQIEALKQRKDKASDPETALVARRALGQTSVVAYETGENWLREKAPALAALYFELASLGAGRWSPWVLVEAARAHALAGNKKSALDALQRAVEGGFNDAAVLRESSDFSLLRGEETFRELLERLAAKKQYEKEQ